MKNYSKMEKAAIRTIAPQGWLKAFLQDQIDGLTGNLEVAGYPFDRVGWDRFDVDTTKSNDNPGWWAYEQTGYMVDGMERTAQLMRDRKLQNKAGKSISYTLENADPDGYLGPKLLKDSTGWNRWPHVVFFRALLARYSATKDKRIIEALKKHYLDGTQTYGTGRDVINVEIMLLVYLECGDKKLLELAEKSFADYNEQCRDDNCARAQMSNSKAYAHGVTYNEYSKLGALLYICTGKKAYLAPVLKAYKKIDRFQMLPDGCHCSNEFLLDNHYYQAHETCDVADYTWALNYLLMATGKAEYADKIEKCIFNAGIGAVDEHFKALQYLSTANQLVLDRTSNHCDFLQGDKWMSYRPNPGTECCAGNVNRFFPNYCASMWMTKGRNSVFSVLFGASVFTHGSGEGKTVITQTTDYPFSDCISYSFSMKKTKRLKFYIRIPGWCNAPEIYVNGEKTEINGVRGFALIDRKFSDSDTVRAVFPSKLVKKENHGGVYFEKGCLLFTYGMRGDRQIDGKERNQTEKFPAYNTYPDKKWNYGIVSGQNPDEIEIIKGEMSDHPFDVDNAPLKFNVKVKEIKDWKFEHHKTIKPVHNLYTRPWKREIKKGDFTFTPKLPTDSFVEKHGLGQTETITLVPYGAGKVRLTVFKEVK